MKIEELRIRSNSKEEVKSNGGNISHESKDNIILKKIQSPEASDKESNFIILLINLKTEII